MFQAWVGIHAGGNDTTTASSQTCIPLVRFLYFVSHDLLLIIYQNICYFNNSIDQVIGIWPRPFRRRAVSDFTSKDDLIKACMASVHIPWFMDKHFSARHRGGRYVRYYRHLWVENNPIMLQDTARLLIVTSRMNPTRLHVGLVPSAVEMCSEVF